MELLPPTVAESLRTLLYQQRALAYILVDNALDLVRAGGFLERYGLTGLRLQKPASSQIDFLEGMLPLAETPFLIRSMEMPSGRIADVHFFAHDEGVWILFLDVTTEHHEAQLVQQKAYDMTLLSEREARLIEELEAANRALAKSQEDLLRTHRRLDRELDDAANYVQSILPARFSKPFVADWRFVPSSELGGDCFDQRREGGTITDIAGLRMEGTGRSLGFGGNGIQRISSARDTNDTTAVAHGAEGDGTTDAPACAGDDSNALIDGSLGRK